MPVLVPYWIPNLKQMNPRITQREMDSMYTVVMANMNKLTVDLNTKLKEQQQAEEQERLRKIQEALEAERAAKEAEEQRQREEIENKRLCVLVFIRVISC